MTVEALIKILEQGGWVAIAGLLGLLVNVFYRGQFQKMWEQLEEKDKLLQDNHMQLLSAFERNTVAFEKVMNVLDEVNRGIKRIDRNVKRLRQKHAS